MLKGRRPEGTALPEGIFCRGRKINEVEAAISLYLARRDPIYIINIPLFLSLVFKDLISPKIIPVKVHRGWDAYYIDNFTEICPVA